MVASVSLGELAVSKRAARFEGKDFGASVSFFVTDHAPGEGPSLHRHPYDETFIVQEGSATFTVDGEKIEAQAGQVLVVPAGSPHGFVNSGEGSLRQVSIHAAPEMQQEWVDEEGS